MAACSLPPAERLGQVSDLSAPSVYRGNSSRSMLVSQAAHLAGAGRRTPPPPCTYAGTYQVGSTQNVDAVLHALSDSSRRTVLEALSQGEATVGELAALLPIARPGVSRHLRVLREAGLVEVRQEAQWRGSTPPAAPPSRGVQWRWRRPSRSEQRRRA